VSKLTRTLSTVTRIIAFPFIYSINVNTYIIHVFCYEWGNIVLFYRYLYEISQI